MRRHDISRVSAPSKMINKPQGFFSKYCSSFSALPWKAFGKLSRGCDLGINSYLFAGKLLNIKVTKRDSDKEVLPLTEKMSFRPRKGNWEAEERFQACLPH